MLQDREPSRAPDQASASPELRPRGDGFRLLAAGILLIGMMLLLWFARQVFLLGFAGLLLSVFLYRIAAGLQKGTRLPYWATLTITCLALVALIGGAMWLVGARLSQQVDALQEQLPRAWGKFRTYLEGTSWGTKAIQSVQEAARSASTSSMVERSAGVLSAWAGGIAGLLALAFIGLFGAISPQLYVRGFMRLVPLPRRPLARDLLTAAGDVLWWWILGQLVAMAFIGVLTGVAMWILGVPLALTLAILAAISNFIPNFGPLLAAAPAVLLALLISPTTALWVIGVYVGIQLLQNNVVTPLVMQRAVQLPPAILLVAQLLMYLVAGVLGMLLAPPLIAVVIRWVNIAYVDRVLHDPAKRDSGFWPEGSEGERA